MSEDGKKRLKDLAKQVRDKTAVDGVAALHQKGLAIVDELAKELTGPDGMPGLKLHRDSAQKFRLQRSPRNAEITVEWEREIGAVALTKEMHGEPKILVRYVWDESEKKWRRLEGGGEIWDDLSSALVEVLYPQAR
jgi:hypothetical protein